MTRTRPAALLGLATLAALGLAAPAALAQTLVTGVHTGAVGAPGSGNYDPGTNVYYGNDADNGYTAPNGTGTSFQFDNATLTGGVGGAVLGTDPNNSYVAGNGGNGLLSQAGGPAVGPQVVVNSGAYVGGAGGAATGLGTDLIGGYGGSGIDVNNSIAVINGGAFTGGDGGFSTVNAGTISGNFAGSGLNSNAGATVTVNGGTFTGGNGGAILSSAEDGTPGAGILVLGGTTNVYGGTFTPGTSSTQGDFGIDFFDGSLTVYGSNFTVTDTTHGTITPNFSGSIAPGQGFITGQLADGATPTTFSYINRNFGGTFLLVAAPEPSAFAALGLGALSLAGLALKAKRRDA